MDINGVNANPTNGPTSTVEIITVLMTNDIHNNNTNVVMIPNIIPPFMDSLKSDILSCVSGKKIYYINKKIYILISHHICTYIGILFLNDEYNDIFIQIYYTDINCFCSASLSVVVSGTAVNLIFDELLRLHGI